MSVDTNHSPIVEVLQSELVEKHYASITNSMRHTAVAILHTAQCVFEAKKALNKTSFKALAAKFGSESSLSKWLTIGERADTLMIHVDALPASNTSLYHLSRLTADKFNEYLGTKQINAFMTNGSAAALLDAPPPSAAANLVSIIVKSDEKTHRAQHEHPQDVTRLLRELKSICDQLKTFGVTVKEVMLDVETATESDTLAA
jgi:hypothetical protein